MTCPPTWRMCWGRPQHSCAAGAGRIGYGAHVAGLLSGVGLGIVLVRCGWVTLYKGEMSLLHVFGLAGVARLQKRPPETRRSQHALVHQA